MHVAINARSFSLPRYTGIGRYAFNLIRELTRIDSENRYSLYLRKGMFDRKRRVPRIKADNLRIKKDVFGFGPEGIIAGMDIYHSPAPEMIPVKRKKLIVTIHDLVYKAFPEGHTEDACRRTDREIRSLIDRADKFICCSESTQRDLQKYFSVPDESCKVIYQGVDHELFYSMGENEMQEAVGRLKGMGIASDYILCVGTIEPRKNIDTTLKAFADLVKRGVFSGQLVIAGMKGWKSDNMDDLLIDLGINNRVLFLGYVQDFELRYLYNCCEIFAFPSMYEGFGFPILEAMCCGAPVITSDVSSCPEVGGEAVITVDPKNIEGLSSGMEDILLHDELRQKMVTKGFQQAKRFSFRKTAEETLDVYRTVMESV